MADAVTKRKPNPKHHLDRVDVDAVTHLGCEVTATHLLYKRVRVRVRVRVRGREARSRLRTCYIKGLGLGLG